MQDISSDISIWDGMVDQSLELWKHGQYQISTTPSMIVT